MGQAVVTGNRMVLSSGPGSFAPLRMTALLRLSYRKASMPKPKSIYRCTECGHEHPKWVGRCEACAAWNSIAEEPAVGRTGSRSVGGRAKSDRPSARPPVRLREVTAESLQRWRTGLNEF